MRTNIELLAMHFREIMNRAYSEGKFIGISPFHLFPNECCDLTCDLLGQYLEEKGIETYQINAAYKYDFQRRHVWLKTNDGVIIDITGDQLKGKIRYQGDIPEVYIGEENELYKLFCRDQNREENTNFTDPSKFTEFGGRPNVRQKTLMKVYEKIWPYLD